MSCLRKRRILNPRYKGLDAESLHRLSERLYGVGFPPNFWIEVPCGNCLDCQKRKFFDYRMRLLYELQKYPNSVFITLTFDNHSLSRFSNNPNKAVRLFLDRVRKHYGSQVRHWIIAEYGSLRGRVHYHGILFDINLTNSDLSRFWRYGYTFVGYANEATARYIVKYLTKQDTKGLQPPRVISSKGIGSTWLDTPECRIAQSQLMTTVQVGGVPYPIPRYYLDKMYSDRDKELISYYYYMETPPQVSFYINGREYSDKKHYDFARLQKLQDYKRQGFFFEDYLKKPRISGEMRYRVALEVASNYSQF